MDSATLAFEHNAITGIRKSKEFSRSLQEIRKNLVVQDDSRNVTRAWNGVGDLPATVRVQVVADDD
jgi:hypothetical protein